MPSRPPIAPLDQDDRRPAERRVPPLLLRLRRAPTTCSPPTRSSTCCRRCGGSSSRAPARRSPTSCARSPKGRVEIEVVRTVPTATGFVTEHVETQHTPAGVIVARRLHLCEVRDGRICAVTTYCNGGWDDELRARHAAEAPMIRP